jgi:hypothetical protein
MVHTLLAKIPEYHDISRIKLKEKKKFILDV